MQDISTPLVLGALLLVAVTLAVFAATMTRKAGLLLGFGGMLLFSSLMTGQDWRDNPIYTVWAPLLTYRVEIYFAFGAITLAMLLIQSVRRRSGALSASAWILLFLLLYCAMLRFVHGGAVEGASSVLFVFVTLLPLVWLPKVLIESLGDMLRLFRMIALVNAVWLSMCVVQYLINPARLTTGKDDRFLGLLGNPQHAAAFLAFSIVTVLWLLLNDPTRRRRVVYAGILGLNCVLLAWTGSRTGMGMSVVGVTAVLYSRAGRAILLLPIAAVMAFGAFTLLSGTLGVESGLSRLASTENTRSGAWYAMFQTGLESPMVGVGTNFNDRSENGWLYAFSSFGIGALAISIVFTLVALWELFRLAVRRFSMSPALRPYADYVIGIVLMYIAGSVFEGYLIARLGAPTTVILVVLGIGAVVRKALSLEGLEEVSDPEAGEWEDDACEVDVRQGDPRGATA